MFKNKLLQLGVIILIALALIAVVVVILMNTILKKETDPNDPNAVKEKVEDVAPVKVATGDRLDQTTIIEKVNPQLSTGEFVTMDMEVLLDSTSAKADFDLLVGKAKDVVISTVSDMTVDEVSGSKGKSNLKSKLINGMNAILKENEVEGKVIEINFTNMIIT